MVVPYLVCEGLEKTYDGTVRALQGVSFKVERGKVHAIIGENGAGKSTLAKLIGGMVVPEVGTMRFRGDEYAPASPRDAHNRGIGMVHQHFALFPSLTVAENIVLGDEPTRFGRVHMKRAVEEVRALSDEYGMPIEPRRRVRDLSVGEQQRVEILKALRRDVELLILDEPTAVLTPLEVEKLFKGVRRLISEERTVIFIAHKLDEVLAIANEITVMRKGQVVGYRTREDATKDDLVRLMVGENLPMDTRRFGDEAGRERLVIRGLTVHDARGHLELDAISLAVRAGEIVGLAGVEGNGQQALELVLGGLVEPSGGVVNLDGSDITRATPGKRRKVGLAYVPADRLEWGCAPGASVFENAITQLYRGASRAGLMNRSRMKALVKEMFERFDVRAPSLETAINTLSGGNIQKLILARELGHERGGGLGAIVISSPSRGIDIRGVEFIHDLLAEYRAAGCAVLLVSTDLDEILALSDRIGVLYSGRLVAVLPGKGRTGKAELGQYMLRGAAGLEAA